MLVNYAQLCEEYGFEESLLVCKWPILWPEKQSSRIPIVLSTLMLDAMPGLSVIDIWGVILTLKVEKSSEFLRLGPVGMY